MSPRSFRVSHCLLTARTQRRIGSARFVVPHSATGGSVVALPVQRLVRRGKWEMLRMYTWH